MEHIRKAQKDRIRFLTALLEYAEESNSFDPHFYSKEIMSELDINEGQFNIIQKNLGDKYCTFTDHHKNDSRYRINTGKCWELYDEFEQQKIHKINHGIEITMLIIASAMLLLTAAMFFNSPESSQIPVSSGIQSINKNTDIPNNAEAVPNKTNLVNSVKTVKPNNQIIHKKPHAPVK